MSLTSALTSARNSLTVRAAETDVVARNIAGVNEAGYTHKRANVVATQPGGVKLFGVSRSADIALFTSMTRATSEAAARSALLAGVNQLQQTVDPALGDAVPAARIGALQDALTKAAAEPSDAALAQDAVEKAKTLARTLQEASATIQGVRKQADSDMVASVATVNDLLSQFEAVNTRIVAYSAAARDMTADLDSRDQIVGQLAQEMGVRTTLRSNGDMQIYTDSGITLFDSTARKVTLSPSTQFTAATFGNPVLIDSVPVTGPDSVMGLQSGRLAGLAQLRDVTAPTYQAQFDEMARGLIVAFTETDQTGSGARAGLFREGSSLALPGEFFVPGLASSISVASTVDRTKGGNPFLLRDGGISDPADPAYRVNTANAASFADRLNALAGAIDTPQSFYVAAGSVTSASLARYASASVGWIEGIRQTASSESEQKSAFLDRAKQALSQATGVNLDSEMSKMLELERAYQGSAKLFSAVDNMLQALLQAAG